MRAIAGFFLAKYHYIKLYEVAWSKSYFVLLATVFLVSCVNNGVDVKEDFSNALPKALEKQDVPLQGREVRYSQSNRLIIGYFSRPNTQVARGSVVLVHGQRGLTERLKLFADDVASEGYAVLAVNLSHSEPGLSKTIEKKKIEKMSPVDKAKMKNLADAITFLTKQEKSNRKVAICGWASGGTLALDYVINYGGVDGTALFYSQLPKDLSTLYNLDHAIYGTFLAQSGNVTPKQLAELSYSQRSAGLYSDIFAYPGVESGFFFSENDNENNKLAAEDAWIRLKAYFRRVLE